MILPALIGIALVGAIEMCEIDGVPTYTDRNDVCDDGQEVVLDQGTFSLVDGRPRRETETDESPQPPPVVIERIIERAVPVVIRVGDPDLRPLPQVHPVFLPARVPRIVRHRGGGRVDLPEDPPVPDSPPRRKPARPDAPPSGRTAQRH